jgi:hypothetical protein
VAPLLVLAGPIPRPNSKRTNPSRALQGLGPASSRRISPGRRPQGSPHCPGAAIQEVSGTPIALASGRGRWPQKSRGNSPIQSLGTRQHCKTFPAGWKDFNLPRRSTRRRINHRSRKLMHVHQYRLHPDWVARGEMFRQFASRCQEPEAEDVRRDASDPLPAARRWPLPKLSYRHRSTFSPRPR